MSSSAHYALFLAFVVLGSTATVGIASAAAASNASVATNDPFEPNDGFGTAANITEGTYDLRIESGESDYFQLELNRSEALDVSISNLNANLNLRLYNGEFEEIASSAEFGSVDERVTRNPTSSGTFYVEVAGAGTQTTTDYTLDVDVVTPAENDPYAPNYNFSLAAPFSEREGLNGRVTTPRIVGGESDFYAVGLVANDTLTVSIEDLGANANLRVHDGDFDQVASSTDFGSVNEEVTVTAESTGIYYVEVAGAGTQTTTDYTLDVDRTRSVSSSVALSAEGGAVDAGTTVTVNYTLENTGSDETASLALGSLPDGWVVIDQSAAGASWDASATTWTWSSIPGEETRNVSVTLGVPRDAPTEPRLVPATLSVAGQVTDVRAARVTVEQTSSALGTLSVSLSPANATAGESTDVTVTVTDAVAGQGVGGATVAVPELGVTATTNASGVATLSVQPETTGTLPVTVYADGYVGASSGLTVEEAGFSPADYDTDGDGSVQGDFRGAIQAIEDYNAGEITFTQAIKVITVYNGGV